MFSETHQGVPSERVPAEQRDDDIQYPECRSHRVKCSKPTKSPWGETRSGRRNGKVTTRPLRGPMSSMEETWTAGFTSLCIFPIQTREIKIAQKNSGFLL